MEHIEPSTELLRFGAFEVDRRTGELRKNGVRVKLQEQPFQVLAALLDRPGEAIMREELRKKLWLDDTFVDFDHSLATAIAKVREALEDGAGKPRYIETLPRRGYRFIGRVEQVPIREPDASSAQHSVPISKCKDPSAGQDLLPATNGVSETGPGDLPAPFPAPRAPLAEEQVALPARPGVRRLTQVVAVAIVGVAVVGVLAFRTGPPIPNVSGYTQITNDGRQKRATDGANLTTDGRSVYFVENMADDWVLASVLVGGGETIPVTTPLRNVALWDSSADGSELLVGARALDSRVGHDEKELWRQPAHGGAPRRLGAIIAQDATESPDGSRIAYANGNEIYVADRDGDGSRKIAALSGNVQALHWSPGDDRIRFSLVDYGRSASYLWEISASGANPHPLFPGWEGDGREGWGNWSSNSAYYIFCSTRTGNFEIWTSRESGTLFARASRRPVQLTKGPLSYTCPLRTPDGNKLLVFGAQQRSELMRYDAVSKQLVPYLPGLEVAGVAFSKDGAWVTYAPPGSASLWRSRPDGSEKAQLTFPPLITEGPCWSPDGARIAFTGATSGHPWWIYVVSASGGTPEELVHTHSGPEGYPSWSPDGGSIAYGDIVPEADAGAGAIHIVNLKTRQVATVPGSRGLWTARWSPDARYLAAVTRDSKVLMLFDFKTAKWKELARQDIINDPRWSRDGRFLYFDTMGASPAVFRVRVSDTKIEEVMSLETKLAGASANWSGLAPDGSPLVLRGLSNSEVYALDWHVP